MNCFHDIAVAILLTLKTTLTERLKRLTELPLHSRMVKDFRNDQHSLHFSKISLPNCSKICHVVTFWNGSWCCGRERALWGSPGPIFSPEVPPQSAGGDWNRSSLSRNKSSKVLRRGALWKPPHRGFGWLPCSYGGDLPPSCYAVYAQRNLG